MLAGLARWLRAAGHDAALADPPPGPEALAGRAVREQRRLLTRNHALPPLAPAQAVLVPQGIEAQAAMLARDLAIDWLHAPFSRCLVDNSPLAPADPDQLRALPPRARGLPGPFRSCPTCGKLY